MPRAYELQYNQAKSNLDLAKANSLPNPTIGVGIRRLNNTNNNALIATFSLPIPLLNQNQGEIAKANAEIVATQSNINAGLNSLEIALKNLFIQIDTAKLEFNTYQKDIIPSSMKAYKQALDGYDRGKFSFLELLDAQRTMYKVQEEQLNSFSQLQELIAYLHYLMGSHKSILKEINLKSDIS